MSSAPHIRVLFAPLVFVLCVCFAVPALAIARWDFENGTLQGWKVIYGDAGKQPVATDDDRHGGNFNKQGRYFIGTYENLLDAAEVELRSPDFAVTSEKITFLIGGGNDSTRLYLALCRTSDNSELLRETGGNSETMQRKYWEVSNLAGETVYLKIVDRHTGSWGHINVDDAGEMSEEELEELRKEQREAALARDQWLDSLTRPTSRKVYRGKELADLAMPLGAVGGGHLSICGDGSIREWQIFNKVNRHCVVPGQFFAIWAKSENRDPVARVLQTAPVDDLPLVKETEFVGEFPIAEIGYKDPELPVSVKLEAFAPFIPMNAKDSATPGIYFVFTVNNPSRERVQASLAASLQNAVGYDGRTKIEGVRFRGYGGNLNTVVRREGFTALHMTNPSLSPESRQFGTMTLVAFSGSATAMPHWDVSAIPWSDFARDGRFDRHAPEEPSRKGRTWNGSLAVPFSLRAGETKSIVFAMTWHFPNYYAEYDDRLAQYRLGRMYSNWFADSLEVAQHLHQEYDRIAGDTRLFRDTFYDSNLPYWFLDRISSQASTLTSQVCLWIEDGTFHAFEGAGCCPMNCTHVWNYEQTMAHLFPELERNMRHTDLRVQQDESGAVRHRTVLPLNLPRGSGPFVDGHLGTILKSYREHRLSVDGKWLDDFWPHVKLAMDFVIRDWDPNADGVLVNEQWNTYDAAMYGPNTFIGTLYLAALLAAERMARIQGDEESADKYRSIFALGSQRLDEILWNGEYCIHIDSRENAERIPRAGCLLDDWPKERSEPHINRPYGTGCHADQLLGQWWAHILELGYVLPQDRVAATLDSILAHNWRWDFAEVPQQRVFALKGDKGLLNCTWPHGGRPENATLYSDEVWTGIEYEVAALMIYEGKIRQGLQIVKAVSDRYNGIPNPPFMRNPWNEIECGDHYARAMSSWSLLLAAQGFFYSGPDGILGFDPRISPDNHRSFFTTAKGWGTFAQRTTTGRKIWTLDLKYGSLPLKRLLIPLPPQTKPRSISVVKAAKPVGVAQRLIDRDSKLVVDLEQVIEVNAGEKLSIQVELQTL